MSLLRRRRQDRAHRRARRPRPDLGQPAGGGGRGARRALPLLGLRAGQHRLRPPGATQDQVEEAARAAQATGFIEALPEGYDTLVGERGYTLSGGQRQRIAIARTLLADPRVLVLDDATSAIDVRVEEEIHDALRLLLAGRTTVVIAHRLSTIDLADRVVLIEGGRVVASGTHTELLAGEPRYAAVLASIEDRSTEPADETMPVGGGD
ncbi:MAG: ATP-binding cassette domain-containing protein [Acidimicrobiales bacterium]